MYGLSWGVSSTQATTRTTDRIFFANFVWRCDRRNVCKSGRTRNIRYVFRVEHRSGGLISVGLRLNARGYFTVTHTAFSMANDRDSRRNSIERRWRLADLGLASGFQRRSHPPRSKLLWNSLRIRALQERSRKSESSSLCFCKRWPGVCLFLSDFCWPDFLPPDF